MMGKIRNFPLAAFLALSGMARRFREDERGLSGVVVAVLLILIAVLAIVIIWGLLSGWISELWARITGETAGLS